jgi:hypothetical protein
LSICRRLVAAHPQSDIHQSYVVAREFTPADKNTRTRRFLQLTFYLLLNWVAEVATKYKQPEGWDFGLLPGELTGTSAGIGRCQLHLVGVGIGLSNKRR